ncbi:hypothetical protein K469DRAFT_751910 [Zopfia rhizophila CBS 207.26]|uniref:Uncharacterized protein n=1 Tax=Zopfia rhizophila CBS 207.26 TaxID=1314779 RepID=A0A6A6DXR4_9PEZI|nr:hypothetical protein K469DRAFT_751910 [Zopfia rhizophila CBS 207.26]
MRPRPYSGCLGLTVSAKWDSKWEDDTTYSVDVDVDVDNKSTNSTNNINNLVYGKKKSGWGKKDDGETSGEKGGPDKQYDTEKKNKLKVDPGEKHHHCDSDSGSDWDWPPPIPYWENNGKGGKGDKGSKGWGDVKKRQEVVDKKWEGGGWGSESEEEYSGINLDISIDNINDNDNDNVNVNKNNLEAGKGGKHHSWGKDWEEVTGTNALSLPSAALEAPRSHVQLGWRRSIS